MSGSSSFARASHGTPPEPLTLTVHGLPGAVPVARTRWGGRFTLLLVLLACAAPVVASYFTYYVLRPQGRSNYAELIQPSRDRKSTRLNSSHLKLSRMPSSA